MASQIVKDLWLAFFRKILENLTSVKVWFFILPFVVSTAFLGWIIYQEFRILKTVLTMIIANKELLAALLAQVKVVSDTFIAWCTFNVSLVGTIIVVREVFKVSKMKTLKELAINGEASETKKQVENIAL